MKNVAQWELTLREVNIILLFLLDNPRVKLLVNTCELDSLPVKIKVHFLI